MEASKDYSSINLFSVVKDIESTFQELKDVKKNSPLISLLLIERKYNGSSSGYFERDARKMLDYFCEHPEMLGRDKLIELIAQYRFLGSQIRKGKLGIVYNEHVH